MSGRAVLLATVVVGAAVTAPAGATGQASTPRDTSAVAFALGDPAPNPFQEEVRIPFRLGSPAAGEEDGAAGRPPAAPDSVRVSVAVYNVLWQRVAWARTPEARGGGLPVRDRDYAAAGVYEVIWRGRNRRGRRVPSGPYFVELTVDGRTAVRKVLLTR